jgi:hypothetical protein
MKTVAALHKELGALIAAGQGRKPVCILKDTFPSPMEADGANVIAVEAVTGPQFIATMDDDGGTKYNRNGSEAGKLVVLLRGDKKEGA